MRIRSQRREEIELAYYLLSDMSISVRHILSLVRLANVAMSAFTSCFRCLLERIVTARPATRSRQPAYKNRIGFRSCQRWMVALARTIVTRFSLGVQPVCKSKWLMNCRRGRTQDLCRFMVLRGRSSLNCHCNLLRFPLLQPLLHQ